MVKRSSIVLMMKKLEKLKVERESFIFVDEFGDSPGRRLSAIFFCMCL